MKSVMKSRTVRALGQRARIARVIVAVTFAGLFTAACKDEGPRTVASITISPTTATLLPNGTQQFTAVVLDNNGDVLTNTPTWAIVSGSGTITQTGLFTAGTTPGTTVISVTCRTVTATATITVNAGAAASIAVLPQTVTLFPGGTQTFTAIIRDGFNNILTITPVWSVPNPPGTIISTTGAFTAGSTLGSFPNTVSACIPTTTICDLADVIVVLPPAPPAVAGFTVLGRQAVTCTNGNITGEVGTLQAAPTGSITQTICPITGGTAQVGTPASIAAFNNFVTTYNSLATTPCGVVLTGTLAGVTLAPGVYCFDAAAAPTGVLTLQGTSTDRWLFKIGTSGTGALTPGAFTVTMAGGALPCNVTWWVKQSATMTDSFFKGSVLAGAAITVIRGNFNGNAWAGADPAVAGDATITGPLTPPGVTGCP